MNALRALLAAAVAAVAVTVPSPAHATSPCAAGQYARTYDLRTGSDGGTALPLGEDDPDWRVAGVPTRTTPPVSTYVVPPADRRWVTDYTTSSAVTRLRYEFSLPIGGSIAGYSVTYAADNGATFEINGAGIGGYTPTGPSDASGFSTLRSLSGGARPAITGVNVFDALVVNTGGPMALLVGGSLTVCEHAATCDTTGVAVVADTTDLVRTGETVAHSMPYAPRPPGPAPAPQSPATVVEDAAVDQTYVVGPVAVRVRGAYGRCVAGTKPASVYAEAGAAEVEIAVTSPPLTIRAGAVGEQAEVYYDGVLRTASRCAIGHLSVNSLPVVDVCTSPLHFSVPGVAEIQVHDDWIGPAPNDGRTHVHRAALRIVVAVTGAPTVEVVVGRVHVGLAAPSTGVSP